MNLVYIKYVGIKISKGHAAPLSLQWANIKIAVYLGLNNSDKAVPQSTGPLKIKKISTPSECDNNIVITVVAPRPYGV